MIFIKRGDRVTCMNKSEKWGNNKDIDEIKALNITSY